MKKDWFGLKLSEEDKNPYFFDMNSLDFMEGGLREAIEGYAFGFCVGGQFYAVRGSAEFVGMQRDRLWVRSGLIPIKSKRKRKP